MTNMQDVLNRSIQNNAIISNEFEEQDTETENDKPTRQQSKRPKVTSKELLNNLKVESLSAIPDKLYVNLLYLAIPIWDFTNQRKNITSK